MTILPWHSSYDRALKKAHPELSLKDRRILRRQLLIAQAGYMETGYRPAVARPNPDGSVDVIILTLEKIQRKGGK